MRERWLQVAETVAVAGLLEWDLASGVARWTPGLAQLLGLSGPQQGNFSDIASRLRPEDRERLEREVREQAVSGGRRDLELRVSGGEERWLAWSGEVLPCEESGGPGRLLAVLTDVSALKRLAGREHAARVRAEREARRATALQVATAALSEAADLEQLAHALLGRAASALGAGGGALYVASSGSGWQRRAQVVEVTGPLVEDWAEVAVHGGSPAGCVLGVRRPLFLGSRAELSVRFPGLDDPLAGSAGALAALPLVVREELLGALVLHFPLERPFDAEAQATLCTLAGLGAQALLRVRLLETERGARAEAEQALRKAERASEGKSRFMAIMSHELRTPLNSVLGYADLLLMRGHGTLTAEQQLQVERIRMAAHQQLELVEGILAYARMEAGRETLRLGPVDVTAVLRDVAETVRPAAEARGLALELRAGGAGLQVLSDGGKLRQVLLNLAGNAVKYTRQGTITFEAESRGEAGVSISVSDTGIGIEDEALERVWEPFTQLDQSDTREAGGTGLGLTIARRITLLLGGSIHAESRPGAGSRFTLLLPRHPPPPPQP